MTQVLRVALTPAIAAAIAALTGPYADTAKHIAAAVAASKASSDEATGRRKSVFASFKEAIPAAQTAGHSTDQMAEGLSLACAEAGVPSGTFRGYVSTVKNLMADVQAGKLTMAEVTEISVADARKRYKPEPTAEEKAKTEATNRLNAAMKEWNAEQIALLADYAESLNAADAGDEASTEDQPQQERRAA